MHISILFLLCMFSPMIVTAASASDEKRSMSDREKMLLLNRLKQDNPSVSQQDGVCKRIKRNAALLCSDPMGFYVSADRSALLLKYVAGKELLFQGIPLSNALGQAIEHEMSEMFAEDQKEQIRRYRRVQRIPDHPGLQQLYYLMIVCGISGYIDAYTPCYCCAAQTMLGCWTT